MSSIFLDQLYVHNAISTGKGRQTGVSFNSDRGFMRRVAQRAKIKLLPMARFPRYIFDFRRPTLARRKKFLYATKGSRALSAAEWIDSRNPRQDTCYMKFLWKRKGTMHCRDKIVTASWRHFLPRQCAQILKNVVLRERET